MVRKRIRYIWEGRRGKIYIYMEEGGVEEGYSVYRRFFINVFHKKRSDENIVNIIDGNNMR